MIKHKLKRLGLTQLMQLRQRVLEIRVMEKGLLDDLSLAPIPAAAPEPQGKPKKVQMAALPKVFPNQVAMFHIEKLRPYQRLDRKYHDMFLK